MEAHQVCARRALKEVCKQLGERRKDTLFNVLLTTVYDPSHWDTYDYAKYFEVTTEVEDRKMHMANRCILAQDQELYWADSEITGVGQDHVVTGVLLILGTNKQPSERKTHQHAKRKLARLAACATSVRSMACADHTGGHSRSGRWLQQLHSKCSREPQ
jgi:hypothetical protein